MSGAGFSLTRRAALDLRDIRTYSTRQWGKTKAERYIGDLYDAIGKAAARPAIGSVRRRRSMPFFMVAAGQHFIVYDRLKSGIVILTILHQRRSVETMIANIAPAFFAEIAALKKTL